MFTECLKDVNNPSTAITVSPISGCFTGGDVRASSSNINMFDPGYWDNNSCTYSVIEYASSDLGTVQDASRALLSWGLSLSPNATETNDVRRIILDLCTSSSVEVCGSFLREACVCNTTGQLTSELERRLCGCYSSQREGDSSTDVIPPQCSPFCAQPGVVAQSGVPCDTQVVCIIDDISVNAQFLSQGNTSLVQRCGGCVQEGTCRCVIDINSNISSSVNVDQICGSGSVCFSRGENGEIKETKCSSPSSLTFSSAINAFFANPHLWIPIITIIFCIICVGILAAI